MKLIETYHRVEKREIVDCRIKSLKEWIRHYGINLSSFEILLLCRAITFHYDTIKIPDIFNFELPYATVSHNKVEETFFNSLEIDFEKKIIQGNEEGWELIKNLINNNIPVLFKIDSRFLKESQNKVIHEQINLYYVSTLLLVGYSYLENEAYIILTNNDYIETYNKISIDDFQKYRKTVCRPFSPEEICYYRKEGSIIQLDQNTIFLKTMEGLKEIVRDMAADNKLYSMDLGGFEGKGITKGIFAMKKLREELEMQYQNNSQKSKNSILKLISIFLRNNLMFGSYSAFRFEFSQCLSYISKKYNLNYLDKKAKAFEEISFEWKKMFIELSKITHEKEDIELHYISLINIFDGIIKRESEQFGDLMEILKI